MRIQMTMIKTTGTSEGFNDIVKSCLLHKLRSKQLPKLNS